MERLGTDFNAKGSVMSGEELEYQRRKKGKCVTCGRQCFTKKLLRLIPITDHGRVLNGRCLNCKPLDTNDLDSVLPAACRPTTQEDLTNFAKSQSGLNLTAERSSGGGSRRRSTGANSRSSRSSGVSQSSRSLGVQSLNSMVSSASHPVPHGGSADTVVTALSSPAILPGSNSSAPPFNGDSRGEDTRTAPPTSSNHPSPASQRRASGSHHPPHVGRSRSHDSGIDAHPHHHPGNGHYPPPHHPDSTPRYASSAGSHEDYDSYASDRSSVASQQRQHELQEAHPRAHGSGGGSSRSIDEQQEAYASSHLAGSVMIDYYNRIQESTRSLQSTASSHRHSGSGDESYAAASRDHRRLNRGGVVQYAAGSVSGSSSGGTSAGSAKSDRSPRVHPHNNHNTNNVGSSRYIRESARSLDSINSFGGEDLNRPSRASPMHVVDPRLEAHLARLEAEEMHSFTGNHNEADAMSASHHSTSHQSMRSNHRSSAQYTGFMESHTSSTLVSSSISSPHDNTSSSMLSMAVSARDNAGLERIRTAGTDFNEIVNIMLDFPDSTPVQSTGMQELSNLHLTPEDSDTFVHIGAHQVIINGMKSFPMDVELQISGCRAMWNASGTSANQVVFVESGAIDVILFAMGHYLDDADVQEQAMATLANLAAVDVNTQLMVERGVVTAMVEGMNKHIDNVHVQAKGCAVVTNMASHSTPLKRTIMEMGGGGAVIIAMVMHPKNAQLQEKALRALRNLSANCDENKIELANVGGIDSVISAMQVHRDESGVQESGAWTLSNLAGPPETKALIGEYGGVDVIVRAMWVHSDNVRVQEWCCRAMFTLSLDAQNCALIQEVGGISAVVNAMQAHVDSSVIQEMGCAVLYNLGQDTPSKIRVVNEEALDAIVLAMVLHSEDVKVQERGCQVLLQLSIVENCKAMQASNIGELAMTAAERFPTQCGELVSHLLNVLESVIAEYNRANP